VLGLVERSILCGDPELAAVDEQGKCSNNSDQNPESGIVQNTRSDITQSAYSVTVQTSVYGSSDLDNTISDVTQSAYSIPVQSPDYRSSDLENFTCGQSSIDNCTMLPSVHPSTEFIHISKHKRSIRVPKTRSDEFMDIVYHSTGSSVKLNKPLILVHQNIRGLTSKTDEITVSLSLDKISPQVLCFSEHHMLQTNLSLVNIENYSLGSNFSRCRYQKGGVCIFMRDDVCFGHVNLFNYCVEKILEICALKLEFNGSGLIMVCLDISPAGEFYQFLHLLEQALLFLYRPSTEFLVCGDCNVDYLLNSNKKQQLLVLLRTFNMIQTVNFPTRFQNNHASATDNVFVDESRLYSSIFPLSNALSDHEAQCLIFDKCFVTDNKNNNKLRNKFKSRLITCETINYFSEQLSNEIWEEVYHNTDVNGAFNYFLSTFLNIYEASFPIIYLSNSNDKSLITTGIKISCQRKRILYNISKHSSDLKIKLAFQKVLHYFKKSNF
jgi:hypothetical protein